MTQQEIYEKLSAFVRESVRGDAQLDGYFDAIMYSIGKRLELTEEQCKILAGDKFTIDDIVYDEYGITDGFVGVLGLYYKVANKETFEKTVSLAAQRHGKSTDDIMRMLVEGIKVSWCDSPNFKNDHSVGIIQRKE